MLQSASILVHSGKMSHRARILFDTGSQRTFITRRLASYLKCPSICKEKLSISAFGKSECNVSVFDLVSVGLQSYHELFDVDALVANTISVPVPMKLQECWLNHPKIRDLDLADRFEEDVLDVDMIIGNDYYGSLITGQVIKDNGMVAMERKFGWLLSGHCDGAESADNQVLF